jgi:hypothetical protein
VTTSAFKLGLPTDIPWTRICVSRDMMDAHVCDARFPPKWNSSIAVFKYVPPEEYQQYPDYDVAYLKVSVSITGYQPHEIEGLLEWGRMTAEEIEGVEDLLNEYQPCTAALVQVEVAPKEHERVDVEQYPYFLDFEPKKRELYEMATDTQEKMSRSLQQLSVGKSTTQSKSLEVLDIDMGSSRQFGMQSTYAGTGGGANGGDSNQGQWGTKDVSGNQSGTMITADNGNEKRETQSFTTQISQLYHLLDAYHVGTNRALFLLESRPHVLSPPSGFTQGPRPLDGIQEFFLIVALPKNKGEFCVSVRLDTAHLAEKEKLKDDFRDAAVSVATSVSPPSDKDPKAAFDGTTYLDVRVGNERIGQRNYDCYLKRDEDTETYIVRDHYAGFKIDTTPPATGYTVVSSPSYNGGYSVDVSPDRETLTAKVWATGRQCFDAGGTTCVSGCPPTLNPQSGYSNLNLVVHMKSAEPILPDGTEKYLLVTTRGLCCCDKPRPKTGITAAVSIESLIARKGDQYGLAADNVKRWMGAAATVPAPATCTTCGDTPKQTTGLAPAATAWPSAGSSLSPIESNSLTKLIARELRSVSMSETKHEPTPYILHDFFADRLERRLRPSYSARQKLDSPVADRDIPGDIQHLTKYFKRERITRRDLVSLSSGELAKVLRTDVTDAARARLHALGVPLKPAEGARPGGPPPKPSRRAKKA